MVLMCFCGFLMKENPITRQRLRQGLFDSAEGCWLMAYFSNIVCLSSLKLLDFLWECWFQFASNSCGTNAVLSSPTFYPLEILNGCTSKLKPVSCDQGLSHHWFMLCNPATHLLFHSLMLTSGLWTLPKDIWIKFTTELMCVSSVCCW